MHKGQKVKLISYTINSSLKLIVGCPVANVEDSKAGERKKKLNFDQFFPAEKVVRQFPLHSEARDEKF